MRQGWQEVAAPQPTCRAGPTCTAAVKEPLQRLERHWREPRRLELCPAPSKSGKTPTCWASPLASLPHARSPSGGRRPSWARHAVRLAPVTRTDVAAQERCRSRRSRCDCARKSVHMLVNTTFQPLRHHEGTRRVLSSSLSCLLPSGSQQPDKQPTTSETTRREGGLARLYCRRL